MKFEPKMPNRFPDDIKNTDLYKKLLADIPNIESDFQNFRDKYRDLWDAEHEIKIIVLQCHLILETFLSDYLAHANPAASRISECRLSFAQKLDLAYHPHTSILFIHEGMKALNKLRNKFAHSVKYSPTEADIKPMEDTLKIWRDACGDTMPVGIAIVSEFTELSCSFLDSYVQSIKRYGLGAGLPGLLDYYNDEKYNEP